MGGEDLKTLEKPGNSLGEGHSPFQPPPEIQADSRSLPCKAQLLPQETDGEGPRDLNTTRLDLLNLHWMDP